MMCVFAVDSISKVMEPLPFKAVQLLTLVQFLAAHGYLHCYGCGHRIGHNAVADPEGQPDSFVFTTNFPQCCRIRPGRPHGKSWIRHCNVIEWFER